MDSNPRSPGSDDTPQRPLIISPAITFRESSGCASHRDGDSRRAVGATERVTAIEFDAELRRPRYGGIWRRRRMSRAVHDDGTRGIYAQADEVVIKGLALAQLDVNRGALDHAHRVRIKAVEWLIDDLSDHDDASAFTPEKGATEVAALPSVLSPEELAPGWQGTVVLCVAGRGSLDEASAAMLVQLLEKRGIGARVVPSEAVSVANLFRLDVTGVQMACLSYLEPGSFANPRLPRPAVTAQVPQARSSTGSRR
jgi:hypothetical protein